MRAYKRASRAAPAFRGDLLRRGIGFGHAARVAGAVEPADRAVGAADGEARVGTAGAAAAGQPAVAALQALVLHAGPHAAVDRAHLAGGTIHLAARIRRAQTVHAGLAA